MAINLPYKAGLALALYGELLVLPMILKKSKLLDINAK